MRNHMDDVLALVRKERERQIAQYGHNHTTPLGFGFDEKYSWLTPFADETAIEIEEEFRQDYEGYEEEYGGPTWMHLIREEVSELFAATDRIEQMLEAIQVAALCVSLVETLLCTPEETS